MLKGVRFSVKYSCRTVFHSSECVTSCYQYTLIHKIAGEDIFLSFKPFRPVLQPTHLHILWVAASFPGSNELGA